MKKSTNHPIFLARVRQAYDLQNYLSSLTYLSASPVLQTSPPHNHLSTNNLSVSLKIS